MPSVSDFEIRPPRRGQGVFVSTAHHPYEREAAPRTPRFSDDGPRTWNSDTQCWELVPVTPEIRARPGPVVLPVNDGSGRWWLVRETSGQPMWSFEAADFGAALVEKRRLCAMVGARSGWARLEIIQ